MRPIDHALIVLTAILGLILTVVAMRRDAPIQLVRPP